MILFPEKYLFEDLKAKAYDLDIPKIKLSEYDYITDNLKYKLFLWQQEALLNFLTLEAIKAKEEPTEPTHLLFNMATGTGKTLVMAALILYYYKKGFRNFIFFVNQNNIVGKTEENLCNPSHLKYLFTQSIVIDDCRVNIKKVNTFADNSEDIQIKFTSIHALHNDVYKVKEDNVFLEDLQQKDIIMLGDEAHHLNSKTLNSKNLQLDISQTKELSEGASQDDIEKSWERTVLDLLLKREGFKGNKLNNNALLEFTATVPDDKEVKKKYYPKTIIKFDLKDFLKAGYTKEINLVSSSFDKKKRILQALLFNWYRHKIAMKYQIPNFKSVILFRSKTVDIAEQNNSKEDYAFFRTIIEDLKSEDFDFLKEIDDTKILGSVELYQKGESRILDVKRFLDDVNNLSSLREVITYLQTNFAEHNCLITNSKTNKTKKEKTDQETDRLLNNLEDKTNHIRAIFTVQRLTEGWDVQNLYDIVRLYEGQNSGGSNKGKTGNATTSEVQLIGRGVRYNPFKFEDKEPNKRKFDNSLNHELRVLEEFYFHSDNDERYLSELKKELKDKEWLVDTKIAKPFRLKESFIASDVYKNRKLFYNIREVNPNRKQIDLSDFKNKFVFDYKIESVGINETTIQLGLGESDKVKYNSEERDLATLNCKLIDFDLHIIRKALNIQARKDNSLFRFCNLKEELAITSMNDILKPTFFGHLAINVIIPNKIYNDKQTEVENLQNIQNEQLLKLLVRFFDKLGKDLKEIVNPYIGSDFESTSIKAIFGEPKIKSITPDEANAKLENELRESKWFALNDFFGTDEERNLIEFLKNIMGNIVAKYDDVWLLRNEEIYKIYDFKTGRGFQPDFILMLSEKDTKHYYQLFIEPKGGQFKDSQGSFIDGKEGWKEAFLQQISNKYGDGKLLKTENESYKLIGLPLFNGAKNENFNNSDNFKKKVKEVLGIDC